MKSLQALINDACNTELHAHSPSPTVHHTRNEQEVDRIMTICNACRYCEGFCAVFPAMTRRLMFEPADVHYL
ncbi:MAG: tricarballylate utilization protein TcuB, partial [Alcaligenes aquatilis]